MTDGADHMFVWQKVSGLINFHRSGPYGRRDLPARLASTDLRNGYETNCSLDEYFAVILHSTDYKQAIII